MSTHTERPKSRALPALIAGALACTALAPFARADEPDPAATAHARQLAVAVCGTCHGVQGNSEQPKFPRLAGQASAYLATQLHNFRAQTRGDPDAISYMWGMASALDDETIEALAQYYARQNPGRVPVRDAALVSLGRSIYENGLPQKGVPPCAGCHGSDAHGMAGFPRLAGQHGQYVLKQLASFQSNMRNVAAMHGVALNLRTPEMEAVAAYLQGLP